MVHELFTGECIQCMLLDICTVWDKVLSNLFNLSVQIEMCALAQKRNNFHTIIID